MFLRKNSPNLTRSLVEMFEEVCFCNLPFIDNFPPLYGTLGYKPATSAVTRTQNPQ